MSATRLLILGAIIERGSAHGYQVRKDLESWQVDLWGNIGQGSVYHALRRLAQDGLIDRTDSGQGAEGPARVEYAVTSAGHAEFVTLLERALSSDGRDVSETMAGIGFITTLTRARAVELLRLRIEAFRTRRTRVVREYELNPDEDWGHHVEAVQFWAHSADSAIEWTEGLIARLESGAYPMADDEPPSGRFPEKG
ncbi:PadR family transcriptional regulator [Promicromonospora iranensis]|uniref:PadR family transcriptional regulator n=1 Tax=Promicromonospora iranensis TaxID=1105144 RepID=UPI0023A9E028|nr:PadR family transcriptional regulator [Promicromonospora iranensis]